MTLREHIDVTMQKNQIKHILLAKNNGYSFLGKFIFTK